MSGESSSLSENHNQLKEQPLTRDQQDLIAHFREVVGNIDFNESVKIMIENDWNLEQAVHQIMDIPPIAPQISTEPSGSRAFSEPRRNISYQLSDGIRRRNFAVATSLEVKPFNQKIIRHSPTIHRPWYWQVLSLVWSPFQKIFEMLYYLFSAFQSEPRLAVANADEDVRAFLRDLTVEVSPRILPHFVHQSYGDCVADAKNQLQFLVVYLHDDTGDCVSFVRDAICADSFHRLVNDEALLLWGCSVRRPEGQRVSTLLRQHTYPFIGVIGLQPNFKLALLARLEGVFSADDLVQKLRTVLRDYEAPLVSAKIDREDRLLTQSIRQQQDRDYEESLRRDQEKENAVRARRETELLAQVQQMEEEEQRQRRVTEVERVRELIISKLPAEPHATSDDSVLVRMQLPAGQLNRRFLLSDSLKLLFYTVRAQPTAPWEFDVISNFPKCVWPCTPVDLEYDRVEISRAPRPEFNDPPSFREFGINSNITVMVIDKEA